MKKYICVHGHFYQPPRENAWLETIEVQDSAHPFHDWNERITSECYGPNAASRILDEKKKIVDIVNNYSRMSFNFGPTLLSWMQEKSPAVYKAILDADKLSIQQFGGHGSAMAQVYNHIIMPLANLRDKQTQVIWGIKDFEHRFGRKPEGMWLAETAVDTETLEVLAENDIRFTVLAPRQAKLVRKSSTDNWNEVNEGTIDTRIPYICHLPSGKSIVLFFYDGKVAQEVAFNGLLMNGKAFADRLMGEFTINNDPQLVNIATDGESYGHHHEHGDMALAYCLDYILKIKGATLTNYAQFIELNPPVWEAQVHEKSSWSCVHGVERWRSNCGCNSGGHNNWNQQWRSPLRKALNWLRDSIGRVFFKELKPFVKKPWQVRNEFIEVILNREEKSVKAFLKKWCAKELTPDEETKILRILEMQRNALLMFTSCGWFFDEISGIETVQILQYACRAIQLAESEGNVVLLDKFESILEEAKSNIPAYGTGKDIYHRFVIPSRLSLSKVGMHYAVNSLFDESPETLGILNYSAVSQYFEKLEAGIQKVAIGKTMVRSNITHSEKQFYFAVVYLGQHHIIGSYSDELNDFKFLRMYKEIKHEFENSNIAGVIEIAQRYFGNRKFSFWELFRDEQLKVLDTLIHKDLDQAENSNRKIFERNYPIMNVLHSRKLPMPQTFRRNLELVINSELRRFFETGNLSPSRLQQLVDEVKKWDVPLDVAAIKFVAELRMHKRMLELEKTLEVKAFGRLDRVLEIFHALKMDLNLWEMQTVFFRMGQQYLKVWKAEAETNDDKKLLYHNFLKLADRINIRFVEV